MSVLWVIFIFLVALEFILIFGFMLGESYSSYNENSKFSKWWRKHICDKDPYDN